jgi:hypothetical protein
MVSHSVNERYRLGHLLCFACQFLKKVKSSSSCRVANNIDILNGASGDANVAEMWRDFYEKLYSVHNNEGLLITMKQYVIYSHYY